MLHLFLFRSLIPVLLKFEFCVNMDLGSSHLPPSFLHEITESGEDILIRSNLKDVNDIHKWMEEFERLTNTKWNLRTSKPSGTQMLCSYKYICHHSGFRKVPSSQNKRGISKNSNCPATITIRIKLNTKSVKKKDEYAKRGLLAVIKISNSHNHSQETSEALRFLPSTGCKEAFFQYFDDGMSISEAVKFHEKDLKMQENFTIEMLANSRLNPTYRSAKYFYAKWKLTNLGPRTGPELIQKLNEKISIHAELGVTVRYTEDPFAVLILTPLMRRAHEIEESEEVVFVDSTSACDAENHCITFMSIPCAAGSLPIGILITKGETENSYTTGFKLLKDSVENAFNKKNHPKIFLTDISAAEINALKNVWPESINLLNIFHVAQAVWRWLWEAKNSIPKDHRQLLMRTFRNILYSTNEEMAYYMYINALGYVGTFLPTYPNWNSYIMAWWNEKEKWCLAYRDHSVRGHHTNIFSEACVRVFKDEVLSRVKANKVLTLIDFCGNTLEKYFCRKLQEFASSTDANPRLFLTEVLKSSSEIQKEDVQQKDASTYQVKSGSDFFFVDIEVGVCSCNVGLFGKFCQHQSAVFTHFDAACENFPTVSPAEKQKVAFIAQGEKDSDNSPYSHLETSTGPSSPQFSPTIPPTVKCEEEGLHTSSTHLETSTGPLSPQLFFAISPTVNCEEEGLYSSSTHLETSTVFPTIPPTVNCEEEGLYSSFIAALNHCNENFGSSKRGLRKITERLRKISSVGEWERFLHSAGSCVPLRIGDGATTRVQPTSIACRASKTTKGSKRLPAGRPPTGAKPSKKRKSASQKT